ncbi:Mitochondrial inner membrane protein OXA1L, partial [Stegodyphus mimosarum]
MSNYMPQLQFLQSKFGEARRTGNAVEASRYASEIMVFMKEHNISPIKNALLPMSQAPVFISFFLGLRAMAKVPVESMKYGGIGWATDLTIPDPYYVLPVIACGTLYIVLKIGAESGVKLENMKMVGYFLRALPIIAFPFCMNFPSAVLYYWCTTNFCTLAFVSILKLQPVRQYFKLPTQQPVDPKFLLPKKSFVAGIKEAYEDQKILAAVEDRRRIDEIRFQKYGTGPIPRTYSYDPTKP